MSLPSPGFHTKVSLPSPMKATSLPRPPMMMSLPSPPSSMSSPSLPVIDVVAGAAVDGQPDHGGGQSGGVDRVVAAEGIDDERVVGPFGALDGHQGRQPGDGEAGAAAGDLDGVGAVGAVDDDRVGLAVAGAARVAEVDVHAGDVGAGEVVDGDRVGAAEGVDVDRPRRR